MTVAKQTHKCQRGVLIDAHWISEWVSFGLIELGVYLEKHAKFSEYLEQKEKQ